jgi:hypothetical protein
MATTKRKAHGGAQTKVRVGQVARATTRKADDILQTKNSVARMTTQVLSDVVKAVVCLNLRFVCLNEMVMWASTIS